MTRMTVYFHGSKVGTLSREWDQILNEVLRRRYENPNYKSGIGDVSCCAQQSANKKMARSRCAENVSSLIREIGRTYRGSGVEDGVEAGGRPRPSGRWGRLPPPSAITATAGGRRKSLTETSRPAPTSQPGGRRSRPPRRQDYKMQRPPETKFRSEISSNHPWWLKADEGPLEAARRGTVSIVWLAHKSITIERKANHYFWIRTLHQQSTREHRNHEQVCRNDRHRISSLYNWGVLKTSPQCSATRGRGGYSECMAATALFTWPFASIVSLTRSVFNPIIRSFVNVSSRLCL